MRQPSTCGPESPGDYRLKFKAQALPHKNHLGGYRVLYSHNCKFGVSQVHEDDRLAMPTLVRVFPPLAALKRSNEDRVKLVNEGIVEELQLPLGKLDFGKGIVAKSTSRSGVPAATTGRWSASIPTT